MCIFGFYVVFLVISKVIVCVKEVDVLYVEICRICVYFGYVVFVCVYLDYGDYLICLVLVGRVIVFFE